MNLEESYQIKAKVLLVHNCYQISGGEDTVVLNEKKLLEANGHSVVYYARHNDEINDMNFWQKLLLPLQSIFSFKTYRDVKKIIKEQGIDLIHVHNTIHLISPSVYYAALKCKIPVVQTIHNFRMVCANALLYRDGKVCEDCLNKNILCAMRHNCYRNSKLQTLLRIINMLVHQSTGVYGKINYICLTQFNKEKLLKVRQIDENRMYIKPNFTSWNQQVKPYSQRKNQFVYIGRLDETKGIRILFEAWKMLGEDAPELIVCGAGELEEWCREFICQNQLNRIEMKGFVKNDIAKEIIAESKALILPTQLYEGFPMTIVEAYSLGTTVIGSRIGNTASIIKEYQLGITFDEKNAADLAEKVKYVEQKNENMEFESIQQSVLMSEQNYKLLLNIYNEVMRKG